MARSNWYFPRYCPLAETAVGSPPDSHRAIRSRRPEPALASRATAPAALAALAGAAARTPAEAEGPQGGGPGHAVDLEPVDALEAAHGAPGPRAVDAVGGNAELALQGLHAGAVGAGLQRGRAPGGRARRRRLLGDGGPAQAR